MMISTFLERRQLFHDGQTTLTKNLMSLPPELAAMVLKNLPDFNSLFSAIQTCRQLYSCYRDNDRSIITSIVSTVHQNAVRYDRQCGSFLGQGSGLIIQQLIVAIKSGLCEQGYYSSDVSHMLGDTFMREDLKSYSFQLQWDWRGL